MTLMNWDEIKNFTRDEFVCKCGLALCANQEMDENFILLLDDFRTWTGITFRVTSGFRCHLHPIEAKKSHPGPHRTGCAADGAFVGATCHEMLYQLGEFRNYLQESSREPILAFTGIGLNQKGDHDERFLHLDTCGAEPWRPRPHVWTY